jgi:hypothetical protein
MSDAQRPALSPSAPSAAGGRQRAAVAVAVVGAGFLFLRATTTLLAGASFDAPGDGWRSIWQLVVVAVLVAGLVRRAWLRPALAVVAVVYLAATLSELVHPDQLLGLIPVDMRDRVVHPLVALLAAAALFVTRPRAGVDQH